MLNDFQRSISKQLVNSSLCADKLLDCARPASSSMWRELRMIPKECTPSIHLTFIHRIMHTAGLIMFSHCCVAPTCSHGETSTIMLMDSTVVL